MLRLHENELFNRVEFNKTGNKLVSRSYMSLGIGFTTRLLGIKPSKFSLAGVEMTIANGNVVPGFFFLVAGLLILVTFFYALFFGFHIRFTNSAIYRLILYRVSARKINVRGKALQIHTFRGRPPRVTKQVALVIYNFYAASHFIFFIFPLVFVIIFEHSAMYDAVTRLLS